jgi:hypothetical protein
MPSLRTPSATEVLDAWDAGHRGSAAERALLLLRTVRTEPLEQLSAMPLGWVAAELLQLRAALFGPALDCLASCRRCRAAVEARVEVGRLTALAGPGDAGRKLRTLKVGNWRVDYRIPSCDDLLALRGDPRAAAGELAQGLIARASQAGRTVLATTLSPEILSAVEREILKHDPLSRIEIGLACPSCSATWSETLDVFEFVWTEVAALAQRLAGQVARLAFAFGWHERDILTMPEERRRRYLELIPA